jgi:hypothetical protein
MICVIVLNEPDIQHTDLNRHHPIHPLIAEGGLVQIVGQDHLAHERIVVDTDGVDQPDHVNIRHLPVPRADERAEGRLSNFLTAGATYESDGTGAQDAANH